MTTSALPSERRGSGARVASEILHTYNLTVIAQDVDSAEVTLWGESALFGSGAGFVRVRHRLSAAARAYESRALLAAGQTLADPAVEEFLGAALRYPPNGADLVPVARR